MPKARQSTGSAKSKGKRKSKKSSLLKIHRDMNVLEVIALHPDAASVLEAYGLHCHGCAFGSMDTLEAGVMAHGLGEQDLENLLADLREILQTTPKRPAMLTLTNAAADALMEIAKGEGKTTCVLRVLSDEQGGFCMEFAEKKEQGDSLFTAPDNSQASLVADAVTLSRIGGSTVDFRDGRFKLDLAIQSSCSCGENCSCKPAKSCRIQAERSAEQSRM